MIYLAQPYSHPSALVRENRFLMGMAVCSILMNDGHLIYAPIVSWHQTAVTFGLPTDAAFWKHCNFDMVDRCDEFWLLTIDGWSSSKGMFGEYKRHLSNIKKKEMGFRPVKVVKINTIHPLELEIITPPTSDFFIPTFEKAQGDGEDSEQQGPDATSSENPVQG